MNANMLTKLYICLEENVIHLIIYLNQGILITIAYVMKDFSAMIKKIKLTYVNNVIINVYHVNKINKIV